MRCVHWKWQCIVGGGGAAAAATVRVGWMGIGWRVSRGQEANNCGLCRSIAVVDMWIGDTVNHHELKTVPPLDGAGGRMRQAGACPHLCTPARGAGRSGGDGAACWGGGSVSVEGT
eukprot:10671940-Prorocentrum_lima.AAC.1